MSCDNVARDNVKQDIVVPDSLNATRDILATAIFSIMEDTFIYYVFKIFFTE